MRPLRLTWVATHPSQYLAPFLRHLAAMRTELDVTALYATVPDAAQFGREFGTHVEWGVPLLEGYRAVVMRPARRDDVFSYDRLRGIDVSGVTRALAGTKPDVALVPGWHSMFLLRAISAARRLGVPLLYRGDSHLESSGTGLRRVLAHTRARFLLQQFTTGLAVGRRARAYLLALGFPAPRVCDVPHCVDNGFFRAGVDAARRRGREALRRDLHLPPDDFVVLFAGKLAEHKKLDDLIGAVARLGSGVTLHVVGGGVAAPTYREAARRAGIHVVFSGFLNQPDLISAYAAGDCLALPSRETWGMVCNEALACGLPLVVSDAVGSADDLVSPGDTGEIFRFGDIDDLAGALDRVRRLVATDRQLAERCRARADAYSFDVAGAALAHACRSTVGAVAPEGMRAAYS